MAILVWVSIYPLITLVFVFFWPIFTYATFVVENPRPHTFFSAYHGVRALAFLDKSRQTPL